jgi:hypothetical protein
MTDYKATAAFDRVLHSITLITYQHLGVPKEACYFLKNLLSNMDFHVITGYGMSNSFLEGNANADKPG